jgi:hypothetical protein
MDTVPPKGTYSYKSDQCPLKSDIQQDV